MPNGTIEILLVGGPADGTRVEVAPSMRVVRITELPKMQYLSYKETVPTHQSIYAHEYHICKFCDSFVGVHERIYNGPKPYDAVLALLLERYPPTVIRY